VAVKLEAPLKKGSTVDTSKIEAASSVARQRVFAGTIDPKEESPVAHVDRDDLHALSPPGRTEDDAVLKKASGAKWWFTKLFGGATAKILLKGRSWRRVHPTPLAPKDTDKEKEKAKEKQLKRASLAAAVAGEEPEKEDIPLPKSTEVGKILHELFEEKRALKIEKAVVIAGGYRTLATVRALTPSEYSRVFGEETRLKRQELSLLKEAVAPSSFGERAAFPLYDAF